MSVLSLICVWFWSRQLLKVNSNTISCGPDFVCQNQVLTCDPGSACEVFCQGFRSCYGATIECADDYSCAVYANEFESASLSTINGNAATTFSLIGGSQSQSSTSATINCPANNNGFLNTCKISVSASQQCEDCVINANDDNIYVFLSVGTNGNNGMIGSTINAANADSVRLYSVANGAFQDATVFCPDDGAVKEQCVIDMPGAATDSLQGTTIFAVEGLNDFNDDGFIPSTTDVGEFTLFCGVLFDESCTGTYDHVEDDVVCLSESACSTIEFTASPSEEPTQEPLVP